MNLEPTLQTAKILTATKLPDRFLDTKIYEPTNPEESRYGNTYLLVEVTTPWFPTAKITKLIRTTFLEEYYHSSYNHQEIKRFEDGLKAVNKKLSDLAGAGQTEWIGNLNAIIATICNRRLYLSHTGTAEAYLFRENKISHITEGQELPKNPTPIQTFSALINGELEKDDRVVFSNAEMYNFVSIDTLRNAVSQISPNVAVDEIAHLLFREKANKVNAIFIYLKDDETIDAKAASFPDTIFLDGEDGTTISLFKKGFKPKAVMTSTKKGVTSLGFVVLKIGRFLQSLTKTNKTKSRNKIVAKKELKKELKQDSKDLSYMTGSIDLNLSKIRERKEQGFFKKISVFFSTIFSNISGLNKKWLYGLVALIIILSVAAGIFFKMRDSSKVASDLTSTVTAAQEKINTADTQAALHNDDEARKLLIEAKTMLEGIKDKPKSPVEVVIMLEKIQEKLDKVNKIARIDNPKELTNLSSVVQNIESNNLVYLDGVLYTINTNGRELLAVITDKGEKRVLIELPENAGKASNLTYYDDNRTLVTATDQGQVFEYNIKNNKLEQKKNALEIAFPQTVELNTFFSTLYFLEPETGEMSKYSRTQAGYDRGRSVYKAGAVNLKDVVSYTIDGSIYLLHENGTVEKTLKGVIDTTFTLKKIPEPSPALEEPNQILTFPEYPSIYILENKNHRLVEFNKNGEYLRQFILKDNVGKIKNLAINEKAKKIYLLTDNKILEVDL